MSLGLVSLGHSRCFEETWPLCLHLVIGEDIASVGFGKAVHVSFDGDESAFRAQSHSPQTFLGHICIWLFPELSLFGRRLPQARVFPCVSSLGTSRMAAEGTWRSRPQIQFSCAGRFQFS